MTRAGYGRSRLTRAGYGRSRLTRAGYTERMGDENLANIAVTQKVEERKTDIVMGDCNKRYTERVGEEWR